MWCILYKFVQYIRENLTFILILYSDKVHLIGIEIKWQTCFYLLEWGLTIFCKDFLIFFAGSPADYLLKKLVSSPVSTSDFAIRNFKGASEVRISQVFLSGLMSLMTD